MYLPAYTALKYGRMLLADKTQVVLKCFILSGVCVTSQLCAVQQKHP